MSQHNPPPVPVVLELARLPREQIGAFFLLGVDKTATQDEVEAHWAKRVIWARKKQIKTPLEDINWARDCLSERDKRVLADAGSQNADITAGTLKRLEEEYTETGSIDCQPVDEEKDLSQFSPDVAVPNLEEVRKSIGVPEIPCEFPAVRDLLAQATLQDIDPWKMNLPFEQ